MIQFTAAEIVRLKEKAKDWPEAVERLKANVKAMMEGELVVPKAGIANWRLYYYCPECSVQLAFDRQSPHRHRCPSCGRIWTGEPYDSAWWAFINSDNYTAAFQMGLLYQITGEFRYARKAIAVMAAYARHYPDYEVHGDIPYNGPGKSGAQTLDEANFLRSFAMAYDLLEEVMEPAERDLIRDNMLLLGADFLMGHRHDQLHNHEVIINSAIAIIGLIFGEERYIQFAVYGPYGILYQLEHGMLADHMWFEGAFGYHFYALASFFAYEKFALHTSHSQIKHPNYRAMMELLVPYLEPGFRIPMLNDTNYGHTASSFYLYEFAYRELGGEKLLYVLEQLYQREPRNHVEAFIYGVDRLGEAAAGARTEAEAGARTEAGTGTETEARTEPGIAPGTAARFGNYHVQVGQSGSTILRGTEDRYLLFKHDRYGGEHDHYDRLALSYLAYGKRIAPDLGTTGYGALMHYDYYKNTGSHNTVTIGGENQAPANGILTRYEERDGVVYVEAAVDWTAPYEMPDSFTIVQWNEEYYKTVKMERKIAWADGYFVEAFLVNGVDPELSIDWVMHTSGTLAAGPAGVPQSAFSEQKPYRHLHSMAAVQAEPNQGSVVTVYEDGGVTTHIFGAAWGQTVFIGKGADNPSVSDINYRIERCYGGRAVFAHVITSSDGACKVKSADFAYHDGTVTVVVALIDGSEKVFEFNEG